MGLNWGSVPDWVAGISTSGTLALGMLLLVREQRNRETVEADNLKATLDVVGADYSSASDLVMTINNFGRTSFWDVEVFRCASVLARDDKTPALRWYKAELDYVEAYSSYQWVVDRGVRLGTGRAPHPRSFELFVHRGNTYLRHRLLPLVQVRRARLRRSVRKEIAEFDTRDDLVSLRYSGARVERIATRD